MKIDFDASYRVLSRQIAASSQSALTQQAPFDVLLKDISPSAPQASDINEKGSKAVGSGGQDSGPMARFGFSAPELKAPQPVLLNEVQHAEVDANSLAGSVKTPSVLGARRLEAERPFTNLRKTERMDVVKEMIEREGGQQGLDPALGMAVVSAESGFDSNAVSRDGHNSKGLFQLLDSTGQQYHRQLAFGDDYDPFNPEQNVKIGVAYLRHLHNAFARSTELSAGLSTVEAANSSALEKLAAAAFNAGEGRVASAQQRAGRAGGDPSQYSAVEKYLPKSTQEYVTKVLSLKDQFQPLFQG